MFLLEKLPETFAEKISKNSLSPNIFVLLVIRSSEMKTMASHYETSAGVGRAEIVI